MRASGTRTAIVDRRSKGKKRAKIPSEDESELSSPPQSEASEAEQQEPKRLTKRRKAETKECPVCHEPIPIRLLARHSELEASRVEEIIRCVGELEPLSAANSSLFEQGSSTQPSRRSAALKAMHTFSSPSTTPSASAIQSINRNRKQRFTKLREMMVDSDTDLQAKKRKRLRASVITVVCPVCLTSVEGDEDVVDAHVESCLAGALEQEKERERELVREREQEAQRQEFEADLDVDGDEDGDDNRGGYVGSVQGTGFHTRRREDVDVEEDIDIDGDDAAVFGAAQFSEHDIVRGPGGGEEGGDEDETVDVDDDEPDKESKAEKREAIIQNPQLVPVESSSTLLCRICLDPYVDPTVSTGCWHTCCRECWLRCLGSTKLCPICKRITGAPELRRVYL